MFRPHIHILPLLLGVVVLTACSTLQNGKTSTPSAELTFPLTPVEADSVILEDFFWQLQQKAALTAYPNLTRATLQPHRKDANTLPLWQNRRDSLRITGQVAGDTAQAPLSAARFVEESARMLWATGQAKYGAAMEYALYNGVTQCDGWTGTVSRASAQAVMNMPGLHMATSGQHLFVNMFLHGTTHVKTPLLDAKVMINGSQPWFNDVVLRFRFAQPKQRMTLHLRVPAWVTDDESLPPYYTEFGPTARYDITISDTMRAMKPENGWIVIDREWTDRDYVVMHMSTPVRYVCRAANPDEVALKRGNLVYVFLNVPNGMVIKSTDAIKVTFDSERHTNVLSAPYYNKKGKKMGTYLAEPYLFNRRHPRAKMFLPIVP